MYHAWLTCSSIYHWISCLALPVTVGGGGDSRRDWLIVCWSQDVLWYPSIVLTFLLDCRHSGRPCFAVENLAELQFNSIHCSLSHINTHTTFAPAALHTPPLTSCSSTAALNMLHVGFVQCRTVCQLLIPLFLTDRQPHIRRLWIYSVIRNVPLPSIPLGGWLGSCFGHYCISGRSNVITVMCNIGQYKDVIGKKAVFHVRTRSQMIIL